MGNKNFEVKKRCLIVHLTEELDHHNALKIRDLADGLIQRENVKHIIFDFSETTFMDSSGIGVIMGRYKRVIFTGGKVAVVGVGKSIDRIIQVSGLYKIIEKYKTVQMALEALQITGGKS